MGTGHMTLDCGHEPSPHSEHTTGTARTQDGREVCWKCSYAMERAALLTEKCYMAYLTRGSEPRGQRVLTTWPGQLLARVTSSNTVKRRGFYGAAFELTYFRAADVHGQRWYGTSLGIGMYARMRRVVAQ